MIEPAAINMLNRFTALQAGRIRLFALTLIFELSMTPDRDSPQIASKADYT
jgi:hypothetical protein